MKNKLWKKSFVLGIVIFFVGSSAASLTENQTGCNCIDPSCYPEYDGILGANGWYITESVLIEFSGSAELYKLDCGEWLEYDPEVGIYVTGDGIHFLQWTCTEDPGEVFCDIFKIDSVPPYIDLNMIEDDDSLKIIASVYDEQSNIDYVRFDLLGDTKIDETYPYEYVYTGELPHTTVMIRGSVYDNSGQCWIVEKWWKPDKINSHQQSINPLILRLLERFPIFNHLLGL